MGPVAMFETTVKYDQKIIPFLLHFDRTALPPAGLRTAELGGGLPNLHMQRIANIIPMQKYEYF